MINDEKRGINLQKVCLHSTVLEATLGHDSGREKSWRFWIQWDISGWRLQDADKHIKTLSRERISLILFAQAERERT